MPPPSGSSTRLTEARVGSADPFPPPVTARGAMYGNATDGGQAPKLVVGGPPPAPVSPD